MFAIWESESPDIEKLLAFSLEPAATVICTLLQPSNALYPISVILEFIIYASVLPTGYLSILVLSLLNKTPSSAE